MIDGDALRDRSELATEVALGALTAVTAFSFARVFLGWSWLAPLLLAAVGSHMVAATARRWNLSLAVSSLVSLAALVAVTTIAFYRNTMWFVLPTRTTWHTFTADVADAWHRFALSVPPVDPAKGFLVAAVLAVWLAGTLADGFAFHVRAGVEALLPSALVFVFVSGLAAERLRLLSAVLWLVAALVFGVLHRNLRQLTAGGWLTRHRRGVVSSNLAVGGAIGLVVLLVTLVVAPSLPGYGAPPLINPHNRANDGTVISPFVQIKGRLVNQSDKEVFTATSSAKTYWRLTALETYSNEQWSSQRTYGDADGLLGGGVSSRYTKTVTQQITLTSALDSAWLPSAYAPQRVDATTQTSVRYDRESSSLFRQDPRVKAGFTYTVTSAVPNLNPDLLREATDPAPTRIQRTYTQLDNTFPDDLRLLASDIAVGATPYDKAIALQNWFRDNFTYDINVPTGQTTSAIRTFLNNKRGYCEQFAGTFAVFARSVGLPSRVAVGFTPGTLESDGKYHVEGRHAHAWPEVYLTGIGWVPFEPTPERGNPDAATYTGVPAQQVDESAPTTAPLSSTTAFPEDFSFPSIDLSREGPGAGVTGTTAAANNAVPRWLVNLGIVVVILLVIGGGWMITIPRLVRGRWERRRRAATSAAGRAIVAWNEVTYALGRAGVPREPSETPLEYAHRSTRARITDGRRLGHLAELVTVAAYSLVDVSDDVVAECEADRDAILNGLAARSSRVTRSWNRIDPRPLFAVLPGEEAVERAERFDGGWSVRAEREAERHSPVG